MYLTQGLLCTHADLHTAFRMNFGVPRGNLVLIVEGHEQHISTAFWVIFTPHRELVLVGE